MSLFWILFQVDSISPLLLFGLVGFYHVPSSVVYFSALSFCLDCCVWGALSAGWKFMAPLNCGVCSLWVGLDQWLVKISWLGALVSAFWWMELNIFSLCPVKRPVVFWGVCGLGMALGSLPFNVQSCVPVLLENYRGVSCTGTCWLFCGGWFQCRYGAFWVCSCLLMFSGVWSSLIL